jgi:molybdopterin converting factor small subunit
VRLFAALKDAVGRGEIELDLPPPATAEDAWQRLAQLHPALAPRRAHIAAAVNRSYVGFDAPVVDWNAVRDRNYSARQRRLAVSRLPNQGSAETGR